MSAWTIQQRQEFMRVMETLNGPKFWGDDPAAKMRVWEAVLKHYALFEVVDAAKRFAAQSDGWPKAPSRLVALLTVEESHLDAFVAWVVPYVGCVFKLSWGPLPPSAGLWTEGRKATLRQRGRWCRVGPTGLAAEVVLDRHETTARIPYSGTHTEATDQGGRDGDAIQANERFRDKLRNHLRTQIGEPGQLPQLPELETNTWREYRVGVLDGSIPKPRLFADDRSTGWLDELLHVEDPSLFLTGIASRGNVEMPSRFFGEEWTENRKEKKKKVVK